ncbi:protein-serine/threonine phosphatase [Salvia divinorum]|uniref:Protein-serine/threonine phosphatase n=1 Tax=Salvia divinorum TaxID=28513 RepID=A0ABD1HX47_SALDI
MENDAQAIKVEAEQLHDVEEGEISDSASVEEISEEDFNIKQPSPQPPPKSAVNRVPNPPQPPPKSAAAAVNSNSDNNRVVIDVEDDDEKEEGELEEGEIDLDSGLIVRDKDLDVEINKEDRSKRV